MATFNNREYSGVPGLNIRAANGVIRFETPTYSPITTSGERMLYTNSSNQLIWNDGSSTTIIGAAGGGGGTPTWETIFASDSTFTITPDASFTIAGNRSTATDVLVVTNVAGGSGSVIQITNSGTGNDIDGTSNTWGVTAAGVATFAGISVSGTSTAIATTGAAVWTLLDNSTTALRIGSSGDTNMLTFDTSNTGTLVNVSKGGFQVAAGNATFISTSNTATTVLVTNNTLTTYGAATNNTGMVSFGSTSLTSGSLLQLNLSDTANVGGFYLTCRETVGGTNDFTIGENGVIAIAGTASTTSLSIALGNIYLTDGTISVITTGTADVLSIDTGANLLTNNGFIITGSSTFTGVTTGSYVYIAPTGLTTGTALSVTAAAASTSVAVVDIQTVGLTSGTSLRITEATLNFTTGAKAIEIDLVAATAGNGITVTTTGAYTGTGMAVITVGAMTTGIGLSVISTTGLTSGSLIRATTSTAGVLATNGAVSITGSGAYTSTANTGLLDVQASALVGTGTIVNIKSTSALQLTNTALNIEQSGTTTGYTGDFVRIVGTSTTGDCNLIAVTSASTTAGDALSITNNGITLGTATLVNLVHGTSVLGAGSSMLRVTSTGVDTGTTTGVLLDLAATAATSATLALVTSATLDSGKALVMNLNGLTTGAGIVVAHTTSVIANGGSLLRASSTSIDTSTTTGTLLDLSSTASLAAKLVLLTDSALATGVACHITHSATPLTAGGSLLRLTSTSIDTSTTTGVLLDLAATAATTGHLAIITSATLTTGSGILAVLNGLTSGSGLQITSSSVDVTARGLVQLTQTGAGATGTSMVRMNQVVTSTNYRKIFTESNTGITLWWGNGTTANALLAATTGDILLNGGSNKPEYCTNGAGSLWTALV